MSPVLMMLPPVDSTKPIKADAQALIRMCSWCDFYGGLGHDYKECYIEASCAGLELFNQVRRLENEILEIKKEKGN